MKILTSTACCAGVLVLALPALAESPLQSKIARIAADAQGAVSVSCLLPGGAIDCDLNPNHHAPMQSVFKFPLAMTVLHLADLGRLPDQRNGETLAAALDRKYRFLPEDRFFPREFSPLQDRYPDANVDVPLGELIELAAGQSDNAAADMLLRIIGGPSVVEKYMRSLGIRGIQLQDGEHQLQSDHTAQYRNWLEPASAVQLLERLIDKPPLSAEANEFLLRTLTNSQSGPHRLRAGLPPGTPLAHKTGTSGEHNGKAEASNDIGLITLPDGRHLAIAVFVTDARANEATRDGVIARIGRAAYDAAVGTASH